MATRDRAIVDFHKAIELTPQDAEATSVAVLSTKLRAIAIARSPILVRQSRSIRDRPRRTFVAASSYRVKGDSDSAISDYDKAIEINARYAVAYLNRGSAFEAKGDHDRAIADYSKMIEINAQDAEAYYGRAFAMLDNGEPRCGRSLTTRRR